jgi:hypothetical protein
MTSVVRLGYEVGSGAPVEIPIRHTVIAGQTQESGKTTTLEALIGRSRLRAVTFITKRGEGSFAGAHRIDPYFREQADWQFVSSILEASRGEKLKFERSWIIKVSRGARTLADVYRNVRKALETAKGINEGVYTVLGAYLEVVVPQIERVRWARRVELRAGVNAVDMTGLAVEMQHLVIRSTLEWVLEHEKNTVVVVPEAWKFIPQGRGTPVKLGAEAFVRQAAVLGNYLWLDSQDIGGVEKTILRSCPVWILGVQREANEIKRTLENVPEGMAKPTKAAIATLELGQFYACWGKHAVKTYVQPPWMDEPTATLIAQTGNIAKYNIESIRPELEEPTVKESEARAMRDENARLDRELSETREKLTNAYEQIEGLEARLERLERPTAPSSNDKVRESALASGRLPTGDTGSTPVGAIDEDELYRRIKARLVKEAPAILRVLTEKPELRVEVEIPTITVKGDTLRGRIGRLIAEGFYDRGATSPGTQKELARRGKDPGVTNMARELNELAALGFLTIEEGQDERSRPRKEYRAVDGMKVNIVER